MEEEIPMSPVRSPAADEAKVKEDQAMAKWRVRYPHSNLELLY
jgi:hypothetical protein